MSHEYLRGRGAAPPVTGGAGGQRVATGVGFPPRPPVGEVLPFRRRAVKPRRRRASTWHLLVRPAAAALLSVATPVALVAWMLTTPRLALAETTIAGTERVEAGWVAARLERFLGRNLLALPLAEAEAALAGHPWLAGVSLRKDLPRTLAVQVVERRPAALVPGPGGLWLADREGGRIVPAPGEAEERFLVVVSPPGRQAVEVPAALAVAAEVTRLEPVWAAGLVRLDALGGGDFRLHTAALPGPLTVRAGRLAEEAGWVEAALPALAARYGEIGALDARFPGRLVVRLGPAAVGGERSGSMAGATG